jgi:hypothetical protein
MKWKADEIRECGACGRWTAQGDPFPSGNRNARTRETPMDNFICDRCQEGAKISRHAALNKRDKQMRDLQTELHGDHADFLDGCSSRPCT